MDRRSLLAYALGAALVVPRSAGAASPPPIFVGVRTVVLFLRVVTQEGEYLSQIPREEMQRRLVEFIRSELAQASLKILVTDKNTYWQPDNYPSEWILWLDCRLDLATRNSGKASPMTVGVTSVVLRRADSNGLSAEPFEIFVLDKGSGDLAATAEAAAKKALKASALDSIVKYNR